MKEPATLSNVEKSVAELIAWGASKKQVSIQLVIPVRKVESYTRRLYVKIGVSKSNELSAWWFCKMYNIPTSDSPLKVK